MDCIVGKSMEFEIFDNRRRRRTLFSPVTPEEKLFQALDISGQRGVDTIRNLLGSGASIDHQYNGWTFFTAVCYLGRLDVLRLILSWNKATPMNFISEKEDISRRGSDVCLRDYNEHGDTPLISAVRGGHLEICRLLVESGASINQQNPYSHQTPLLVAIECCHSDIIGYLLSNHADVQMTDNVGITPLYAAIKSRNENVVGKLIEYECDVNTGSQDHAPVFLATRLGLLSVIKLLCQAGCDINVSNKYGVTPVYEAALKGHNEVLAYLLDQGSSPNKIDMYNQSPLHVAALSGHLQAVQLLVEGGAEMKLRNQRSETALDVAMEGGRAEIVEYLLKHGAKVFCKSKSPRLHSLCLVFERGHKDTLKVLLRGCAKLPIPHCVGVTEIFRNNENLLKMLLLSGIQTIPGNLQKPESHSCKDTADWLKTFQSNPLGLKDLCRVRIRRCLGNSVLHDVQFLPLPRDLKLYITMDIV